MTPADLDALIERLNKDAVTHKQQGWDGDAEWDLLLAATLTRLRDENKERAEIIENHRAARKSAEAELADRRSHDAERQQEWFEAQKRAERAEAEVARLKERLEAQFKRLTSMDGLLANAESRIAALEAERADLIKINNGWAMDAAKLEEERDALAKDAERYKEVKKYARSGIDMTTNGVKGKTVWRIHLPSASWHSDAWTGDTLDAAIDAAKEKP